MMQNATPAQLVEIVRRLKAWTVEDALPFWASAGWDAKAGGFHERLHIDGSPDHEAIRRVRVQARQIYVYAHASVLGWRSGSLQRALDALDTMIARYRSPDGAPGFVHTVHPDGSVESPLRDAYDHAFILLALAWLARASGDAQVRALIGEVLAFVDEHLADGEGAYWESAPHRPPRRQNPHMHLFEAMLALHETIAYPGALVRASGLRTLLERRFVDPASGALAEFFTDDWRRLNADAPIEPGHHAEWCWLLHRYGRLAGTSPGPRAAALLSIATRSLRAANGLLPDHASISGTSVTSTSRCWPQTELARAWLAEHALGTANAAEHAARALGGIEAFYLSGPPRGAWFDQLDAGGKNIAPYIPASTFYHLFGVIAEADRVLFSRA